jgi:hypothetical protein
MDKARELAARVTMLRKELAAAETLLDAELAQQEVALRELRRRQRSLEDQP